MTVLEAIEAFTEGERAPAEAPKWRCAGHRIHLALVVPDIRLFQLLKSKAYVVQPPYDNVQVALHVLIDDKKDPLNEIPWTLRVALVESGLAHPEDARITYPDQTTLGWPTENSQ